MQLREDYTVFLNDINDMKRSSNASDSIHSSDRKILEYFQKNNDQLQDWPKQPAVTPQTNTPTVTPTNPISNVRPIMISKPTDTITFMRQINYDLKFIINCKHTASYLKIEPDTEENHTTITKYLDNNNIPYYIITPKGLRPIKCVIRGTIGQCHQLFGHSSINCRLPARCVKCAGPHLTGDVHIPLKWKILSAPTARDHIQLLIEDAQNSKPTTTNTNQAKTFTSNFSNPKSFIMFATNPSTTTN
ncbi:hypothetical protein CEXT_613211 [Caerostris extrusa]|uniref:Uncharacterized protein n=1 Tax=Caerostris extrusa TaxID=172846 RepID=A0AAV4RPG6_CAEEX|nr:hypothetical protein CEXT_613211 [Caerostris extrusa]